MNTKLPPKEIVTVTEMARMCRLSRARFYQLIGEGIFPSPSRNQETKRPFYDREQQEQCLLIRRSNKGANGKAVMFYGCRLEAPFPRPKRKLLPISRSSNGKTRRDPVVMELRHGLSQLGLTNLADVDVRRALVEAYPDGHVGVESSELLGVVFTKLSQSQDNA